MLDAAAIQKLSEAQSITAARDAIAAAFTDGPRKDSVALPDNFSIHDLEKYLPTRRRARGTMTTSVIADFAEYAKQQKEDGAAVFIDTKGMHAIAVLNLGNPVEPGHADNRAQLVPKQTAAYAALRKIADGTARKQTDIAEFLEDWRDCIACRNDSTTLEVGKAIAAVRNITIEGLRKLESKVGQLSESMGTFESVTATSAELIPTTIEFTCQPYKDLKSRTFVMRLGILTSQDKPTINLRIAKIEEHEEDMASELADEVKKNLADADIPVMLGSYSA